MPAGTVVFFTERHEALLPELGTDSGYWRERDPAVELTLLTQAGLGWREKLAMLTTSPASRFGLKTGNGVERLQRRMKT